MGMEAVGEAQGSLAAAEGEGSEAGKMVAGVKGGVMAVVEVMALCATVGAAVGAVAVVTSCAAVVATSGLPGEEEAESPQLRVAPPAVAVRPPKTGSA